MGTCIASFVYLVGLQPPSFFSNVKVTKAKFANVAQSATPALFNTVVCIPNSSLPQKINQASRKLCRKEKKLFLSERFYQPCPLKLTFLSELLLSGSLSLPHFQPVCLGLVILSHFQLPSLLSILLFSTYHHFPFFCHSPTLPLFFFFFAADAHSNQSLSVFTSVLPAPVYIPSAQDFPPREGRQVSANPKSALKEQTNIFFVTSWTVIEDNKPVANSCLQIKAKGYPRLCSLPTLHHF